MTVVCSARTANVKNKLYVILVIVGIWLVTATLNCYVIVIHTVKSIPGFRYCGIEDKDHWEPLIVSFFVCAYLIPLLIICVLYIMIILHLRQARAAMMIKSTTSSNRSARVTRVIISVILCFMLSWAPLQIQSMVSLYGTLPAGPAYEFFRILWHCLAYGNSCCNPIIYNYVSQEFRKAFREILCCNKDGWQHRNSGDGITVMSTLITRNGDKNVASEAV